MYTISRERIIELNRGDTFEMPLFINIGTKFHYIRYIVSDNDTVYLSICEPNDRFEKGVIRKMYSRDDVNENGDVVIKLTTEDTERIVPGCYYLEIKIKFANGDISTIVPRRKFYLYE